MTYLEIQLRIQRLCTIGGWANVDPPPDWGFLSNEGLRLFSTEAQYMPGETTITTVANQAEYVLDSPPNWLSITDDCTYGIDQQLYLADENTTRRQDRMWRQRAADTPRNIWMTNKLNTVRVHPKPSAADITVYIFGWTVDEHMTELDDRPNCRDIYHEGAALFGACHHGDLYARGEEVGILDRYRAKAQGLANKLNDEMANEGATVFQMRMQRRPQDRLILGREARYSQR